MTSVTIDRTDGLNSAAAIKGPCRVATTANIVLSGLQTIDGVVLAVGDRVLVKDQTAGSENGIYVVDTGPWRRAKDFNKTKDVVTGTIVYVTSGTTNADSSWVVTSANPISIGTASIMFEKWQDALARFHADGVTNDDANFTWFEGKNQNRVIDLRGADYLVTSIPTGNKYVNGRFKIGNFYYPAPGYFEYVRARVTNSSRENNWPQGKMCYSAGILYVPYLEGEAHGAAGASDLKSICMKRSYDAGQTWEPQETLISARASEGGWACFSAGNYQNRLCMVAYTGSDIRLWHKRMPEEIKTSQNISCENGSNVFTVLFDNPHGLVTGDNIIITGAQTLGGQIVNGRHTVTRTSALAVTYVGPGNANATTTSSDTTIGILVEEGPLQSFSITAPNFDSGLPPHYFHDFAVNQAGAILVGAQRAEAEVGILKITDPLGTPAFSLYEFVGIANRVEPTLASDGAGNIVGFLRTEQLQAGDGSEPLLFFYSTNDGASYSTSVVTTFPTNGTPNLNRNIVAVDIHDGVIYGFTGQRERSGAVGTPNVEPEYLPAFLLEAPLADALSSGWSAFKATDLGDCFHLLGAKGAQVPSMTIMDDVMHVAFADSSRLANSWLVDYAAAMANDGYIKGVSSIYHLAIKLNRGADKLIDQRIPKPLAFSAPALRHRWISDANLGSGFSIKDWTTTDGTIRMWKDDQNRVRLDGKIAKTNDANTRLLTLPLQFRPHLDQQFSVYGIQTVGGVDYDVTLYCLIKGTLNTSAIGQLLFPGLASIPITTIDLSQISFIADGDQR